MKTINYKDIPDNIKNSRSVNEVRSKCEHWPAIKVFREYIDAYNLGPKIYDADNPKSKMASSELESIAIYYVLRKTIFSHMSPLLGCRSKKFIMVDNKNLVVQLDQTLEDGLDKHFDEAQEILKEIVSRWE